MVIETANLRLLADGTITNKEVTVIYGHILNKADIEYAWRLPGRAKQNYLATYLKENK